MPYESGRDGVDWIVNHTEVLLRTYKDFWIELANGRTPADEHLNGLKLDIVDDRVVEEKWIRLTTPQFRMEKKGTVKFEFKDIENGWWKRGILFDFMELKKIRDLSI
ncbi:uncharacterized protein LOC111702483 [Eurytemora carolleeae]|uniref:uncharacterized protein LOC111702483 n=1 Tax=Eurytemora carolleeae TaxID=1294199 RepID=UPI000C783F98|nr:uncharacterized protein LOC111702483 [Eurytemora carolleeae]|eukprot:XP_023329958.1 uncharacterized protein LOC111702483 [Eurytemora affinis]